MPPPKGALGEETARLLGSFIVAGTWQAAAARARTPEHSRIDATLSIDEAHNFLTLPYPLEDMLAEARGYLLSMLLAHQHLAQLPRDLREGISANARNKIFFNASPEDAAALERHTLPTPGRTRPRTPRPVPGRRSPVDRRRGVHRLHPHHPPATVPVPGRAKDLRQAAAGAYRTTPLHPPLTPATPPLMSGGDPPCPLSSRLRPRLALHGPCRDQPLRPARHTDVAVTRPSAHHPRPVAHPHAARTPRPDHAPDRRPRLHLPPLHTATPSHPPPTHSRRFLPSPEADRLRARALHPRPRRAPILAAHVGCDLADLGWRPSHTGRIAYSPSLGHDLGVNDLLVHLAARARTTPGSGLTVWLSEKSCARRWGDIVRPDAYAHWQNDDRVLPFFLEYDTGSQPLARVEAKLTGYAAFGSTTGTRPALLIHTRTQSRDQAIRRRLAGPVRELGLHVATASADFTTTDPWGPWWSPLQPGDTRRTTLTRLAALWHHLAPADLQPTDADTALTLPVPPLPPATRADA